MFRILTLIAKRLTLESLKLLVKDSVDTGGEELPFVLIRHRDTIIIILASEANPR
jgi:hypothetical protein